MTLNDRNLIYAQDSYVTICDALNGRTLDFFTVKFDWDNKDSKRWLSKCFYDPVFHATNTHTGFISQASIDKRIENKKNNKKHQPCYDHVTTPQFLLRFLVDCKPDIFNYSKEGFNEFLYWFELATSVIEVTNPENTLVRQFTKFRNGNYQIFESSDKKYKKAGIKLCERPVGVTSWIKSIPTNRVFVFRDEFLDYEREFIK
tara:strand:- start:44 stop:649 length:606 start_codon:yes stop_codon:yes gene_type:complete